MNRERLLESLRRAMEAERDGFRFYSLASENSEDRGARETFAQLAAEEKRHFEGLQAQYRSVLDAGTWNPDVVWAAGGALDEEGGFFSDEFRRRLKGKHHEMSALSIGILLEKQAFQFYSQQAAEAEEEEIRRFFRELAEWENGHYQLLVRQDEAMREDYWNENRFAPLL